MASTKMILMVVRIIALIFLILATVCLGIGQYGCFKHKPGGYTETFDANGRPQRLHTGCLWKWQVGTWSDLNYHLPNVRFQYFPFVFAIITFVILLILLIGGSFMNKLTKMVCLILAAIGAVLMLICFCLEAWYTSGAGYTSAFEWFYVESWLAGTVFFFFTMVLLIVDAALTFKT